MQVSFKVTPEVSHSIETSTPSQEKSPREIIPDTYRAEYEEVQKAKKALADFLEPTIVAANNGAVIDKTFGEIVQVGKEKAKKNFNEL